MRKGGFFARRLVRDGLVGTGEVARRFGIMGRELEYRLVSGDRFSEAACLAQGIAKIKLSL